MVGINKWRMNKWLDLVDVCRLPFFFPVGQSKLLLCLFFFFHGERYVQDIVSTAQTPVWWKTCPGFWQFRWPLEGLIAWAAKSPPTQGQSFLGGLHPLTSMWDYGVQPSQPYWSHSRRVALALQLSPWGWLSLGCITAQLAFFPSLPPRLTSRNILHTKFHLGVCFLGNPTGGLLFCFQIDSTLTLTHWQYCQLTFNIYWVLTRARHSRCLVSLIPPSRQSYELGPVRICLLLEGKWGLGFRGLWKVTTSRCWSQNLNPGGF